MMKMALRSLSLALCGLVLSFVVAAPQEGETGPYERVPNNDPSSPDALFPRWMTFTKIDALALPPPPGFRANGNPVHARNQSHNGEFTMLTCQPSVGVDSRGVAHVVQVVDLDPDPLVQRNAVTYYNTRYDLRRPNGFSNRTIVWEGGDINDTETVVDNYPELWVDTMDRVHVTWSVRRFPPGFSLQRTDIAYRRLDTTGWSPALGSEPTYLTNAQWGTDAFGAWSEHYVNTAIAVETNGNAHVFGTWRTTAGLGAPPPSDGFVHINVSTQQTAVFNSPYIGTAALSPMGEILLAGGRVDAADDYEGPCWAPLLPTGVGAPVPFGTAMDSAVSMAVDSGGNPHFAFLRFVDNTAPVADVLEEWYYNGQTYSLYNSGPVGSGQAGSFHRIAIDSRDQVHIVYMTTVPIDPIVPTTVPVMSMAYATLIKNPLPNVLNTEWRRQEPIGATISEYWRMRLADPPPPSGPPDMGEVSHGNVTGIAISKTDVIHVVDSTGHYTRLIDYGLGARDSLSMVPALPGGSVNVTNGNLHFSLGLFSTRGVAPTQSLGVLYNSLDPSSGLIAPGWKLNYEIYLVDHWQAINNPNGSYWDQPQEAVTLFLGDGRPVHFRYRSYAEGDPDQCYLVADDDFGFFARLERMAWNTLTPEYTLTFKSGETWTFNNQGKLREIQDLSGNCIRLDYTNGLLSSVSDQTVSGGSPGRATSIEYGSSDSIHGPRISSISDPAGKSYVFTYPSEATVPHLLTVRFASGPSAPTWKFEYSSGHSASLKERRGFIKRIMPPRGNIADYGYTCRYLQDNRVAEVEDPAAPCLSGAIADSGAAATAAPKVKLTYFTPPMPQQQYETRVTSKRKNTSGGEIVFRYLYDPRRGLVEELHDPFSEDVGYLRRTYNEFGLLTEEIDRYDCSTTYEYWDADFFTLHVRDNLRYLRRTSGGGSGMDLLGSYAYQISREFTRLQTSRTYARSAGEASLTERLTSYQYDSVGRLGQVSHPAVTRPDDQQQAATVGYQYNGPRGALSRTTDENGNHTLFTSHHSTHGLPQSVTRPGGTQSETFTYDSMGNQISHTAPTGGAGNDSPNASSVVLDGVYRVYTSTDPGGYTTTYTYDVDSNVTVVQPPAGGASTTAYDVRGFVSGGSTPDGDWAQWVDEGGIVQRSTDIRNFTSNYDHDDLGRLIEARTPGGSDGGGGGGPDIHETRYEHDLMQGGPRQGKVIQAGSTELETVTTFDIRGRAISVLQPDGATRVNTVYNEIDEVVAVAQLDDQTVLSCQVNLLDHRGRQAGSRIQEEAFSFGQSPPAGSRTTWVLLDAAGGVVQQVGPRGDVTSSSSLTDKVTYLRDERGRVSEVHQPVDGMMVPVQKSVYGADDRVIETQIPDPTGQTTDWVTSRKYAYTARKELKSSLNKDDQGTTFAYSVLPGQIDTATNESGTVTKTNYHSGTQRVSEVIEGYGTAADVRRLSYWTEGMLTETRVFNPQMGSFTASHQRIYDAAGRLERLTAPGVEPEIMTYDDYGNLDAHTSGSATATHLYNSLGRRTDTEWSGDYSDAFDRAYDANGNLTRIDDGNLKKEWTYNPTTGLPEEERVYLLDQLWKTQSFIHDEAGNMTQLSDGEGNAHNWVYDDSNRLTEIRYSGQAVSTMEYNRSGSLKMTTLRNGSGSPIAETRHAYDSKGRHLRSHTTGTGSGSTLSDLRWEYDSLDRVTKILYQHLGVVIDIGYNFRGEVTSEITTGNGGGQGAPFFENAFGGPPTGNASNPSDEAQATPAGCLAVSNRSAGYTYDRGGNRTSQTIDGVTTEFTYDSGSRLVSESSSSRTVEHEYDTWGNETERTTTESGNTTVETFGYNALNRMATYVRTVGGTTQANWQYEYWPSGDRATKTNLVTGAGQVFANVGDNVVTEYTRSSGGSTSLANSYAQGLGLDQKSTRISQSGARRHYVGDMVGTVSMTLTDSGSKSEEAVKDIWGATLTGDTNDERYGFAQREHDMESGLVYMRHRMYDPRIGRFTQTDPLVGNRAFDHYAYARNNPISGTDPSGLIVQFTRTQGTSRREADAKALADWLGYDLHVTGAGILTITGNRSSNLDGGALPGEFEAMVNSKTVHSAEDIFQRVLQHNSNGRALFDLATNYYAELRPDMLDTNGAAACRGMAAGQQNFTEGLTLGAYQAPQWAKDDPAAGFSRLMGNVTLAASLAPIAAASTPVVITTGSATATTVAAVQLIAPLMSRPLPIGMSQSRFGVIMRWGGSHIEARAAIAQLNAGALKAEGITIAMLEKWRDFYRVVALESPKNPVATGRADLMEAARKLLLGE